MIAMHKLHVLEKHGKQTPPKCLTSLKNLWGDPSKPGALGRPFQCRLWSPYGRIHHSLAIEYTGTRDRPPTFAAGLAI